MKLYFYIGVTEYSCETHQTARGLSENKSDRIKAARQTSQPPLNETVAPQICEPESDGISG
jgi:hypothetical protein